MDPTALRQRVLPFALFGLTFAVRCFALWRFSGTAYATPESGDIAFYTEWGRRIAGGELTDFHAFYAQPLYAYLLGLIFTVGLQPIAVAAIQAALDALTSVLIFQIALVVFADDRRRAIILGVAAAIGWAFFVPAITYSLHLIPSSWVTAAWWFAVWWVLRRSTQARALEWFCVAALIGVVAMMSAVILFALPLLFLRAALRRNLLAAAALLLGVAAGTAPAWLHNAFIAHDPVFLSAHSGLNFWIGNNPEANGFPRVPRELPSEQAALLRESITIAERAAGQPLKRSAVSDYWSARARSFISSDPSTWLRLTAVKARNFWSAFVYDDLSSITALRDARIVPPGLTFGVLAACGLAGAVLGFRRSQLRWITATIILQMCALLPVFVNERYRMAAAPGLLILSVFWLSEFWTAFARFEWRRASAFAAILAAATWFVSIPPAEPTLLTVDDYKTARRHIAARQYERAEARLRRAFAAMVPAPQVAAGVANGFAESAAERLKIGDRAFAREIIEHAIRINPADPRHREFRRRIDDTTRDSS